MELGVLLDRLIARRRDGDIDRRSFVRLLGATAASYGIVSTGLDLGPPRAHAGGRLRIDGHGTAAQQQWQVDLLPTLTSEYGIAIEQGSFTGLGAFLSQVEIAPEGTYNVFPPPEPLVVLQFYQRGLLEEIDETQIPRFANVMERPKTIYRALTPDGSLPAAPYQITGNAIAYNTDRISREEMDAKGGNILLDPAYRGQISGEDDWQMRMWYAALQSGQDPNNITDLDAVWDKIRESRGVVLKYWGSSAEGAALLTSGEVVVNDYRFAGINALRRQGLPFDGWPRSGTQVGIGGFGALKGTPMEAFYQFMDVALRPEIQFELTRATAAMSLLNPTVIDFPEDIQAMPGFDPTGTMDGFPMADGQYWVDNQPAWQPQVQRIMTRG